MCPIIHIRQGAFTHAIASRYKTIVRFMHNLFADAGMRKVVTHLEIDQ